MGYGAVKCLMVWHVMFPHAGLDPPSELNLRPVFARVPPPLYSCDDEVHCNGSNNSSIIQGVRRINQHVSANLESRQCVWICWLTTLTC